MTVWCPCFLQAVLNHETYILDLVEANMGNVQWKLEYSAKVIHLLIITTCFDLAGFYGILFCLKYDKGDTPFQPF